MLSFPFHFLCKCDPEGVEKISACIHCSVGSKPQAETYALLQRDIPDMAIPHYVSHYHYWLLKMSQLVGTQREISGRRWIVAHQ